MSVTCRSSPVKSKRPYSKQSPSYLLHFGIKRKVLKQEYTKIFTKIKIDPKARIQSSAVFGNAEVQKRLEDENRRLRRQIKRMEDENDDLKSRINKQIKLDNMVMKKIQNQQIAQLSLQKAMEIKLLAQVQSLQEKDKENMLILERLRNQLKFKQKNIAQTNDWNCFDLYAILNESTLDIKESLSKKDQNLKDRQDQLSKLRQNIEKIVSSKQQINQQISYLDRVTQKVKSQLPMESKRQDEKDKGVFGVQSRVMVTSSIQNDISHTHSQVTDLQNDIQHLMEQKIREKIYILSIIDDFKNEIIKIKHFQVRNFLRK